MLRWGRSLAVLALCALASGASAKGSPVPPMFPSGDLDPTLLSQLPKDVHLDSFGNAWVTRGSGAPHVLYVMHRDEPGYVVSSITGDGFLRLQRLGTPASALFDQFMVGRRVLVYTKAGVLPGVVSCPSTHFRRGPDVPVPEATVDDLWIDVGAESEVDVAAMGIALLDPVVTESHPIRVGPYGYAGFGAGTAAIRGGLLHRISNVEGIEGTLTVAFVAGGSEGGRGSRRLLATLSRPDSVVVFEPVFAEPSDSALRAAGPEGWRSRTAPGDSSLVARTAWSRARGETVPVSAIPSADARVWAAAGIPTSVIGRPSLYRGTHGEFAVPPGRDDPELTSDRWYSAWDNRGVERADDPHRYARAVLQPLLDSYGVSGNELEVAAAIVRALLPEGASSAVRLDERGNLILKLGDGPPDRLFVAHQDEIGYRVNGVDADGRGRVQRIGGFYDWLYEGEIVRVSRGSSALAGEGLVTRNPGPHSAFAAIVPPRSGFGAPSRPVVPSPLADQLRPPAGPASRFELGDLRIDAGSPVRGEASLQVGDDVTVMHHIAALGDHRISARAIDDRYGCAALVMAAKELWPRRKQLPSTVWLVWSVEEEIGLNGATWLADSLLHHGMLPKRVHAVDTFVSSDSPLEDQRYGDAKLGKGAVVRAVDTSHEAPIEAVRATLALARREDIPLQYGVTSGGNDGVPFAERGSINVPLAWPLRYSHSAVEVADLRDLESLTRLIIALSKEKVSDDPSRP